MENQRIIVVDDNNDQLELTKQILEKSGYEVRTLHEGQNVLELARSYQPGLIFMDHNLPLHNGVETTRLLKSDETCNQIPVIYFTGESDIIELAAAAGADGWLRKPFTLEDLVRKTKRFIRQ